MPRPTQIPSSQPPHERATRRTHPSRRRATTSQRPERYEVRHHPRRVISAHIGNEPESVGEGNERRAAHNLPRRSSANLLVKRLRRVRFGPWEWIGLCASTAACLLLLRGIAGAQSEQHRLRELVTAKQTQLSALNQQKNEEEKKLAYMRSEKGREQVLAERGYLKHGDRILVFPADDKKQQ